MKRSTKVSRHEKRIAKIDLRIAVKTREIRELDKAMARLHAKRTKLEEDRRELNFDRADIEDRMSGTEREVVASWPDGSPAITKTLDPERKAGMERRP